MTRALGASFALLVLGASPPAAAAEPTVALTVDVSSLPEDDVTEALEARMVKHQRQTLIDGGLDVVDDADSRIRIVVSRVGDKDVHYRATVMLLQGGSFEPKIERTLICELCSDSEFITKVGEEVARMTVRVLYAPPDETEPKAKAEPEAEPDPPPREETEPPTGEPPRKLGPLGYAGIGALAVGGVSLGVGIGLALLPDESRIEGTQVVRRSTRTPGLALVGVGSAVLVTGAVLVTLDQVRRNKPRKVSLVPTVTPSTVSVGMHMRF